VAGLSEEVDFDGRRGLRAPAHRRVRGAGRDAAGVGAAVIADVTGGVIALALLVYLVVALVSPERF
jgi:K+-transporting ATPase KdpF subunit